MRGLVYKHQNRCEKFFGSKLVDVGFAHIRIVGDGWIANIKSRLWKVTTIKVGADWIASNKQVRVVLYILGKVGLHQTYFLSVIGPTQLYFLSVLSIICLSYIFKGNNKPKYPAGPRTDNQGLAPVLHKICLSGPVGPKILEKSV